MESRMTRDEKHFQEILKLTEPYDRKEQFRRRRLWTLRIMICALALALIVFICLYVGLQATQKRVCKEKFNAALSRASELMQTYQETEFDRETNFRELIGELQTARQMQSFIDVNEQKQICLNELYHISVKLPRQFILKIDTIQKGVSCILDEREGKEEYGYSLLRTVLDEVDRLDYEPDGTTKTTAAK